MRILKTDRKRVIALIASAAAVAGAGLGVASIATSQTPSENATKLEVLTSGPSVKL